MLPWRRSLLVPLLSILDSTRAVIQSDAKDFSHYCTEKLPAAGSGDDPIHHLQLVIRKHMPNMKYILQFGDEEDGCRTQYKMLEDGTNGLTNRGVVKVLSDTDDSVTLRVDPYNCGLKDNRNFNKNQRDTFAFNLPLTVEMSAQLGEEEFPVGTHYETMRCDFSNEYDVEFHIADLVMIDGGDGTMNFTIDYRTNADRIPTQSNSLRRGVGNIFVGMYTKTTTMPTTTEFNYKLSDCRIYHDITGQELFFWDIEDPTAWEINQCHDFDGQMFLHFNSTTHKNSLQSAARLRTYAQRFAEVEGAENKTALFPEVTIKCHQQICPSSYQGPECDDLLNTCTFTSNCQYRGALGCNCLSADPEFCVPNSCHDANAEDTEDLRGCQCKQGFEPSEDGTFCQKVNEKCSFGIDAPSNSVEVHLACLEMRDANDVCMDGGNYNDFANASTASTVMFETYSRGERIATWAVHRQRHWWNGVWYQYCSNISRNQEIDQIVVRNSLDYDSQDMWGLSEIKVVYDGGDLRATQHFKIRDSDARVYWFGGNSDSQARCLSCMKDCDRQTACTDGDDCTLVPYTFGAAPIYSPYYAMEETGTEQICLKIYEATPMCDATSQGHSRWRVFTGEEELLYEYWLSHSNWVDGSNNHCLDVAVGTEVTNIKVKGNSTDPWGIAQVLIEYTDRGESMMFKHHHRFNAEYLDVAWVTSERSSCQDCQTNCAISLCANGDMDWCDWTPHSYGLRERKRYPVRIVEGYASEIVTEEDPSGEIVDPELALEDVTWADFKDSYIVQPAEYGGSVWNQIILNGLHIRDIYEHSFNCMYQYIDELNIVNNPGLLTVDAIAMSNVYLSALKVLRIVNSGLEYINDNTFVNNAQLYSVDISGNNLETLEDNAFGGLPELISFTAARNLFTSVPNLLSLTHVNSINLSGSLITTILETDFMNTTRVEYLNINNNQIETVEAGSFAYCRTLQTLDLSHNKIRTLNAGIFDGSALQIVNLAYNMMYTLPDNVFLSLTNSLHTLDLSSGDEYADHQDFINLTPTMLAGITSSHNVDISGSRCIYECPKRDQCQCYSVLSDQEDFILSNTLSDDPSNWVMTGHHREVVPRVHMTNHWELAFTLGTPSTAGSGFRRIIRFGDDIVQDNSQSGEVMYNEESESQQPHWPSLYFADQSKFHTFIVSNDCDGKPDLSVPFLDTHVEVTGAIQNSDFIHMLTKDNKIYYRIYDAGWRKVFGALGSVTLTGAGYVWGVNKAGFVYKNPWPGHENNWSRESDGGFGRSITAGNNHIWVRTDNGELFKRNVAGGDNDEYFRAGGELDGKAFDISCDPSTVGSADLIYAIDNDGYVWWTFDGRESIEGWHQIPDQPKPFNIITASGKHWIYAGDRRSRDGQTGSRLFKCAKPCFDGGWVEIDSPSNNRNRDIAAGGRYVYVVDMIGMIWWMPLDETLGWTRHGSTIDRNLNAENLGVKIDHTDETWKINRLESTYNTHWTWHEFYQEWAPTTQYCVRYNCFLDFLGVSLCADWLGCAQWEWNYVLVSTIDDPKRQVGDGVIWDDHRREGHDSWGYLTVHEQFGIYMEIELDANLKYDLDQHNWRTIAMLGTKGADWDAIEAPIITISIANDPVKYSNGMLNENNYGIMITTSNRACVDDGSHTELYHTWNPYNLADSGWTFGTQFLRVEAMKYYEGQPETEFCVWTWTKRDRTGDRHFLCGTGGHFEDVKSIDLQAHMVLELCNADGSFIDGQERHCVTYGNGENSYNPGNSDEVIINTHEFTGGITYKVTIRTDVYPFDGIIKVYNRHNHVAQTIPYVTCNPTAGTHAALYLGANKSDRKNGVYEHIPASDVKIAHLSYYDILTTEPPSLAGEITTTITERPANTIKLAHGNNVALAGNFYEIPGSDYWNENEDHTILMHYKDGMMSLTVDDEEYEAFPMNVCSGKPDAYAQSVFLGDRASASSASESAELGNPRFYNLEPSDPSDPSSAEVPMENPYCDPEEFGLWSGFRSSKDAKDGHFVWYTFSEFNSTYVDAYAACREFDSHSVPATVSNRAEYEFILTNFMTGPARAYIGGFFDTAANSDWYSYDHLLNKGDCNIMQTEQNNYESSRSDSLFHMKNCSRVANVICERRCVPQPLVLEGQYRRGFNEQDIRMGRSLTHKFQPDLSEENLFITGHALSSVPEYVPRAIEESEEQPEETEGEYYYSEEGEQGEPVDGAGPGFGGTGFGGPSNDDIGFDFGGGDDMGQFGHQLGGSDSEGPGGPGLGDPFGGPGDYSSGPGFSYYSK